jgi:DNA-binding beta-propeller fold protein YncE
MLPAALVIDGDNVIVGELQGRVAILDKTGKLVAEVGKNTDEGIGSNRMPPEQWRTGFVVAPHGVAVDADGNLYVAEFSTFGRVHKFTKQ